MTLWILLLDTCLSMNEFFRETVRRLPGDGTLRRDEAADAVLIVEGWMIGGVKLGVLGVLAPRGNRGACAVCGVVTARRGGVVVPTVVDFFAARAFSR